MSSTLDPAPISEKKLTHILSVAVNGSGSLGHAFLACEPRDEAAIFFSVYRGMNQPQKIGSVPLPM